MFRFGNASARSNSEQVNSSQAASFQILARRPVQNSVTDLAPSTRAADPLRETLPWPLPESVQQQLSAACRSIRDTDAYVR
jgi:hypothetical protein